MNPPTPNMGLILPTDQADLNVWGVFLNEAIGFDIDRHDHTIGKGVKIPSAALNINADVSWSAAAVSRAITDLKAIDFTPSASSGMTALAGALFVSDGTGGLTANELYWRTTGGTNVKVTAGSALNVAAFTGGIGGDYSAVSALLLFDDATDSYWMQQQVGASVRQYARIRSADLDLYEFKAHPTAGVPTNRIRLQSPTSLAASYALTLPTALNATGVRAVLEFTNAGAARFRSTTLMLNGTAAQAVSGTVTAQANSTRGAMLFAASSSLVVPIPLSVSATFSAWQVYIRKVSDNTRTVSAQLFQYNMGTDVAVQIGATQSNSANAPGVIPLVGVGASNTNDTSFYIVVSSSAGAAVSDQYLGAGIQE